MKTTTAFLVNTALTCLTMAVILVSCSGCTDEELTTAQGITSSVGVGLAAAPLAIKSQPWYIVALIVCDIVSSALAAFVAWNTQNKSASKGK